MIQINQNIVDTGIVDEKNTVANAANINDSIDQNIVDGIVDESTTANASNDIVEMNKIQQKMLLMIL